MTTEPTTTVEPAAAAGIDAALLEFLATRTKSDVEPDQDLFASGLVSSMFAMELVVFLEQRFGVAIVGSDLQMDNFRTVRTMTDLVTRLRDA